MDEKEKPKVRQRNKGFWAWISSSSTASFVEVAALCHRLDTAIEDYDKAVEKELGYNPFKKP